MPSPVRVQRAPPTGPATGSFNHLTPRANSLATHKNNPMKTLDIIKPIRPHLNHRALPLAALALATACGLNSAQAFSIVWDTATNTTADTDVVTTGTLVRAVAASGSAGNGATVNGVVFTPYASTASNPYPYSGYTQYNTQS